MGSRFVYKTPIRPMPTLGLVVAYLTVNLPFAIWIMNAFFAHANWRELSHDLDAAGIRWRRAERASASAA